MTIVIIPIIMLIVVYTVIMWVAQSTYSNSYWINPWTLHRNSSRNLNWFGCWLVSIISWILNPICAIVGFVFWMCHRNADEGDGDDYI